MALLQEGPLKHMGSWCCQVGMWHQCQQSDRWCYTDQTTPYACFVLPGQREEEQSVGICDTRTIKVLYVWK